MWVSSFSLCSHFLHNTAAVLTSTEWNFLKKLADRKLHKSQHENLCSCRWITKWFLSFITLLEVSCLHFTLTFDWHRSSWWRFCIFFKRTPAYTNNRAHSFPFIYFLNVKLEHPTITAEQFYSSRQPENQ